jgi:hypothetical protein
MLLRRVAKDMVLFLVGMAWAEEFGEREGGESCEGRRDVRCVWLSICRGDRGTEIREGWRWEGRGREMRK